MLRSGDRPELCRCDYRALAGGHRQRSQTGGRRYDVSGSENTAAAVIRGGSGNNRSVVRWVRPSQEIRGQGSSGGGAKTPGPAPAGPPPARKSGANKQGSRPAAKGPVGAPSGDGRKPSQGKVARERLKKAA